MASRAWHQIEIISGLCKYMGTTQETQLYLNTIMA